MSKTKKAQRASQHIMQAMEHGMVDLVHNGFSPAEAVLIITNSVVARSCLLVGGDRSKELYEQIGVVFDRFTTPSQPTAPAAEPEKPVRPEFVPETTDFPVEENEPKQERPRTPAEILYPKR